MQKITDGERRKTASGNNLLNYDDGGIKIFGQSVMASLKQPGSNERVLVRADIADLQQVEKVIDVENRADVDAGVVGEVEGQQECSTRKFNLQKYP